VNFECDWDAGVLFEVRQQFFADVHAAPAAQRLGAQLRAAVHHYSPDRRAVGESTPDPAARRLEALAGPGAAARQLPAP